ncbi:MAG: hypothetical protein U0163_05060 [Gemmatimonadaceae bacterium]
MLAHDAEIDKDEQRNYRRLRRRHEQAGALVEKKEYARSEQLLKSASPSTPRRCRRTRHVAIAHIKLARTYAAARRYADAERRAHGYGDPEEARGEQRLAPECPEGIGAGS